jgi:hypothetical protein
MEKWKLYIANRWSWATKGYFCVLALATFVVSTAQTFGAGEQNAPTAWSVSDDVMNVEDGKFRCPESFSSPSDRAREVKEFLSWVRIRHSSWPIKQIMDFRIAVLTHYKCSKTLDIIGRASD